jgi:hypothetical protein
VISYSSCQPPIDVCVDICPYQKFSYALDAHKSKRQYPDSRNWVRKKLTSTHYSRSRCPFFYIDSNPLLLPHGLRELLHNSNTFFYRFENILGI